MEQNSPDSKAKTYENSRMEFSTNLEFIITTFGFACGFGSIWRFPYLVYKNGGGAFMIPYLILLFILAIPVFFLEISVGQIHKMCLPQILNKLNPRYKGIGYVGTYICGNVSTYYNLLMAYSLYYFIQSFRYPLPWQARLKEGQSWSTEFFYEDVLDMSPDIMTFGHIQIGLFLCYVFSQILVFFCIRGGVKSSGKVAMYTATAPYFILTILLVRGLFLTGAGKGIYYLFVPDFNKLFEPQVWVDAANQVIFQLSLGVGALVAYGSYRKQSDELNLVCLGIPLLTMTSGIMGSLVVFTYMGHICFTQNISMDQIPLNGPELAFVLYPAALSQMYFSNLWAIFFFLTMILLGIDSQFALMDTISGTIEDAYLGKVSIFGKMINGEQLRFLVCSIVAVSGLLYCNQAGLYVLELVDMFTTTLPYMCLLMFQVYFFCVDKNQFQQLCQKLELNGTPMPRIVQFLLSQVILKILVILSVLSIYGQIRQSVHYPWQILIFGWTISLVPFAIVYKYYYEYYLIIMEAKIHHKNKTNRK